MDIFYFDQFLSEPLIPAIAILLILVFIYLIYRFQLYRQHQPKSAIKIPVIDENIKKRRPQQDQHIIVPSTNKTHGVTSEPARKTSMDTGDLDDDPQEKPLFPGSITAPSNEPEKSCEDLYKELLDPEQFEEALYNELLEGTGIEEKTQSTPTIQTLAPESKPGTRPERPLAETESELLLTELEKEFMELEKDLHGNNISLDDNPYAHTADTNFSFEGTDAQIPSLPPKDISVKDLQMEMEETISKLSQQVENKEHLKKKFSLEEIVKKEEPVISPAPKITATVKPTHEKPEIHVKATPQSSPPPKTVEADSSKEYIKRLKSFQSNLEQRFGSFDIANDPIRKRSADDDSLVDRVAHTAGNGKKPAKEERDTLALLESFLFTASQRNRK